MTYRFLASLVMTLFITLTVSVPVAMAQKPNIIMIMTDDQDTASLAYMPKLRALLMDKGVTFTNAFAQFPLCCPSRAAKLSGQFAHNHHVLGNNVSWNGAYPAWKPTEGNSLGPWMQNSGYQTVFVGKYVNGYEAETFHVPTGWSKWRGLTNVKYWGWTDHHGDGTLKTGTSAEADYLTDNQTKRTVNTINNAVPPFMNMTWTFAPHVNTGTITSIPAPRHYGTFNAYKMPKSPAFNSAHVTGKHPIMAMFPPLTQAQVTEAEVNWRRYMETLQAVDDMIESVVNALTANGYLDNTYIIFTSDNGNLHYEWKRTEKLLPYERSVRIPLIIRGPGVPQGVRRDELVLDTDLAATILDWGDAAYGRVLDGKSLAPLLSTNLVPWRSAIFMTGLYDGFQVYDHNFTRWNAVRTKTRKYIRSSDGHEELYDMEADPFERFSVVGRPGVPVDPFYASDLDTLRALELELRTCAGTSCWVP